MLVSMNKRGSLGGFDSFESEVRMKRMLKELVASMRHIVWGKLAWRGVQVPLLLRDGNWLGGRKMSLLIGDQLETTYGVKRRPFGGRFEDNWRPIIKLSIVSSKIDWNKFKNRKMALLFIYSAFLFLFKK